MPSAKRWPVSSAFPSRRCQRIGPPSPRITGRCTPPTSWVSAEALNEWRTICSVARDRGYGHHSGSAPLRSRGFRSASGGSLIFGLASGSSGPHRAPIAFCQGFTAAFLRPSVLPGRGARRRHGWLIDRWTHLPDGAIGSGSVAHYYRLPKTVTNAHPFAAKVVTNSRDLLCAPDSEARQ